MATQVNRQVNIFISSGEAEKAYDRLIKKEIQLKDELKKATDPRDIKRLETELKKLEEPLDRAAKKVKGQLTPNIRELKSTLDSLQRQIKLEGVGTEQFNKLSLAIRQAKIEMTEAKMKMDGINQSASKGNLLTRAGSGINSFTQSTFGVGIGGAGIAGAALAAGAFLKTGLDEALEAEDTLNRLQTTLQNLGKEKALDGLAASAENFAKQFSFIDNDEVLEVFNNLLTYGKLTEQEIQRVTPVIIDFAAKNRISLEESGDVIIKALEGNSKALKTYGIDIKEAGTTTERLNIIMTDLKTKVDGAAAAFGETNRGQVKSTKQELLDTAESIGTKLLPALNVVAKAVQFVMIGIQAAFSLIGDGVSAVVDGFNFIFDRAQYNADRLEEKLKRIQDIGKAEGASESLDLQNKSIAELNKKLAESVRLTSLYNRELKRSDGVKGLEDHVERMQQLLVKQQTIRDAIQTEIEGRQQKQDRDTEERLKATEAKRKAAAEKSAAEQKKRDDERRKLLEDIENKVQELSLVPGDAFAKALLKINDFYDGWRKRANQNAEDLLRIENLRQREQTILFIQEQERLDKIESDRTKRNSKRKQEEEQKLALTRMQNFASFGEKLAATIAEEADKENNRRRFKREVDMMKANRQDRLRMKIDELNEQRILELNNAEKTGHDVADINRKYDILIRDEKIENIKAIINEITGFLTTATGMLSAYFDMQTQRENESLERDRRDTETKKDNYRRQLDGKILTQKEYDKKVQELERKQEQREREIRRNQFERDQVLKIAQATINTAEAVAEALPNYILAAAVGAFGLAQIGIIASTKPPKFETGGRLEGPRHSAGGMPVINPRTGRKVAEVEGGEVILSRNTVRNNAPIVDMLLHTSMHRNGATINPTWKNISPSFMNVPALSGAIQDTRMFDKGGIMPKDPGSALDTTVLEDLQVTLANIQKFGIPAYSILSQHNQTQDRLDAIVDDATMK